MAQIDAGSMISDVTVSSQLQPQERIAVQNTIKRLLNDPQAAASTPMEFSKESKALQTAQGSAFPN